ncbi:MAG: hypothetical protein RL490_501, partial [Pseudomonadota bacterium]
RRERRQPAVAPQGAAIGFDVDASAVAQARQALVTTVHFTKGGTVAAVVYEAMAEPKLRAA